MRHDLTVVLNRNLIAARRSPLALLAISLAGFLLGPFAMAYLDRWQRRNVLIVSDALRALVVVMIA